MLPLDEIYIFSESSFQILLPPLQLIQTSIILRSVKDYLDISACFIQKHFISVLVVHFSLLDTCRCVIDMLFELLFLGSIYHYEEKPDQGCDFLVSVWKNNHLNQVSTFGYSSVLVIVYFLLSIVKLLPLEPTVMSKMLQNADFFTLLI